MPYELNAVNRGMYIADNLNFLKSLNDECIDLVCIDPPFAKNETFGRKNTQAADPLKPPLTQQERQVELDLLARWGIRNEQEANEAGIDWPETRYKDFWSWENDIHEEWLTSIEQNHRPIKELIEATQYVHGPDTAAYLCYMAVRIFEIHRVLKPTGSLYLHCDHTAGAYLRQLLDGIFGRENFLNEIIWHYRSFHGQVRTYYPRKHDSILFYRKTRNWTFNRQFNESNEDTIDFTRWKDYLVDGRKILGRNMPMQDTRFTRFYRRWVRENGREPMADDIVYEVLGQAVDSVWDIKPVDPKDKTERLGYPTQKPIALAERIIKASSNKGDMVLDCFAGCAYVAVAAERLGRQWVACDINPRAWTVFKRQFSKPKLALLDCAEPVDTGVLMDNVATVHGPGELPVRTSPDHEDTPDAFALPERKFKVPSSIFTNQEMLEYLLEQSGWQAWCCGFANRRPDGAVIPTTRNFHLDHVDPKSKDGANEIYNRAPLCPYHNTRKGNQWIHLADYRQQIAHAGEMMVDSVNDLPNLAEVNHRVHLYWAQELPKRRPQAVLP